MKRRLLLAFAALILSAGLSQAASAGTFTLTLNNPNQTATPGSAPLSYYGTITNTSGTTLYLTAFEYQGGSIPSFAPINFYPTVSCPGNAACYDESPFDYNAPQYLTNGTSYTGLLFYVDVPQSSAITTFSGIVSIGGGLNEGDNTVSTNKVGFSTTVTPEPSSWLLMATGLAGLAIAYRFRPQTAPAMTRL